MVSASFLATQTLQEIVKKHAEILPKLSQVILHDFYMNDLLTGCEMMRKTQQLKIQISTLLKKYGLRKWASNHRLLTQEDKKWNSECSFYDKRDPKTLGLSWNPEHDTFTFT